VVKGAKQTDVFAAINEELSLLRIPLERDPDPAEDSSTGVPEEPANDWPAADG
jgi:hypothetical protein